jgi:chitodextrinase/predicted chitinase
VSRRTLVAAVAAAVALGGLAVAGPLSSAFAADCGTPWSSSAVYTGGAGASYGGHNWTAKWWTQGEAPSTGGSGVWADKGTCSGGGGGGGNNGGGGAHSCDYPDWVAGKSYGVGSIVRYTDGKLYRAEHENPGYDPVISSWFWKPYSCDGGGGDNGGGGNGGGNNSGFVVSEAQFNQMFPNRNSFYTYRGLTDALSAYAAFAKSGDDTTRKQEAAAFLANVNHETGGLVHVVEQNTANYPHYCDTGQPYGCPAGQAAYYGRGPIQLSWNFNYKAAGDALGIDLLRNPYLVQNDAAVAWKTGIWYWMTSTGPGTMTPHDAMVNHRGFGETIRSINGSLECNGRNPAQVQSRVDSYQRFVQILGTSPGGNLSC